VLGRNDLVSITVFYHPRSLRLQRIDRADTLKGRLLSSHSSEMVKAQKYLAAVTKENRIISLHVLIFLLSFILKNKTVPWKNYMRTFLAWRRVG